MLEKTKFEYSSLGMSLSKSFKQDNGKNIAKSESKFNYDSNYKIYRFYKVYDEIEEVSLDSKYNRIKGFNKSLIKFKAFKPKNPKTQLKKERIMLTRFTKKCWRDLQKVLQWLQKWLW